MTSVARPHVPTAEEPVSAVDRVVEDLREALFEGDIAPGTPLREIALADTLGVSRPTVREALAALVAEGLAVRAPHKGTTVRLLSPDDVVDVCRARLALEVAGLSRWHEAAEPDRQAVRDALARFEELVRAGAAAADLNAAHLAIHRALTGLTGSSRLVAMAESLYAEVRLALASVDRARGNLDEQVHSHGRLLALLEADDAESAVRELEHHLEGAATSMIASLGLADSTSDDGGSPGKAED